MRHNDQGIWQLNPLMRVRVFCSLVLYDLKRLFPFSCSSEFRISIGHDNMENRHGSGYNMGPFISHGHHDLPMLIIFLSKTIL